MLFGLFQAELEWNLSKFTYWWTPIIITWPTTQNSRTGPFSIRNILHLLLIDQIIYNSTIPVVAGLPNPTEESLWHFCTMHIFLIMREFKFIGLSEVLHFEVATEARWVSRLKYVINSFSNADFSATYYGVFNVPWKYTTGKFLKCSKFKKYNTWFGMKASLWRRIIERVMFIFPN